MNGYRITIPDIIYEKAQSLAQQTNRQVDDLILERLENALNSFLFELLTGKQTALKAMKDLPDDALWTIAREEMPRDVQEYISMLMTRNTLGTITDVEAVALAELIERGDQLAHRKAQAMKHLTDRGHKVTSEDENEG